MRQRRQPRLASIGDVGVGFKAKGYIHIYVYVYKMYICIYVYVCTHRRFRVWGVLIADACA